MIIDWAQIDTHYQDSQYHGYSTTVTLITGAGVVSQVIIID